MLTKGITRRNFVQQTSSSIALILLSHQKVISQLSESNDHRFRIATIGASEDSVLNIASILQNSYVEIVATYDNDGSLISKGENKVVQNNNLIDLKSLLSSNTAIDAIIVGKNLNAQLKIVIKALRQNIHVLCESNPCRTLEEFGLLSSALNKSKSKYEIVTKTSSLNVSLFQDIINEQRIGTVKKIHVWENNIGALQVPHTSSDYYYKSMLERYHTTLFIQRCLGLTHVHSAEISKGYTWNVSMGISGNNHPSTSSIAKFNFIKDGVKIELINYFGSIKPSRPKYLSPEIQIGNSKSLMIFEGTNGAIASTNNGEKPLLVCKDGYSAVGGSIKQLDFSLEDWISRCRGNDPAHSLFSQVSIQHATAATMVMSDLFTEMKNRTFVSPYTVTCCDIRAKYNPQRNSISFDS